MSPSVQTASNTDRTAVDRHRSDDPLGVDDYALLFDRSSVPTLVVDLARRRIVRANPAALAFLGRPADEVLGRRAREFLVEPSAADAMRVRGLRSEQAVMVSRVHTTRGVRTVEIDMVPSTNPDVVFVQAVDLTDLLETTRRAERRAAELAEKSSALESLATHLSHDLRTPLTAIAGFADLLAIPRATLSDDDRQHLLERIGQNARSLATMVDSIVKDRVGIGSPDSGSGPRATDDLFDAVRGILELPLAEAGAELLTTSQVADLPVEVSALQQPIVNLVSNSIKYRHPSRRLCVEVAVRETSDGVDVVVRDNGRGVDGDPEALFEAGARGDSSAGTTGTGLGLSFVRAWVESLGGSIRARALPVGCEFTMTLVDTSAPASAGAAEDAPALGLSARQLDRAIDTLPTATLVIDLSMRRIVRANQAALTLLGRPESEVVGRPGADFVSDVAVAELLRTSLLAEPGQREPTTTDVATADGPIAAMVSLVPVPDTTLAVAQVVACRQPTDHR